MRCMVCGKEIEDEVWLLTTIFEAEGTTSSDTLTVCAEDRKKVKAESTVVYSEQHWKRVG